MICELFADWRSLCIYCNMGNRGGMTIWKLGHCPKARGQ
ncbi:unnamed protein product [Staurois parvus]|uniref:Uncharacterized protein n=1 Tax=Staurois parvus TaxID=386267 RepID=A0ABN9G0D6_9NEOB|nr:unnamed protein product [Staurois parvus]